MECKFDTNIYRIWWRQFYPEGGSLHTKLRKCISIITELHQTYQPSTSNKPTTTEPNYDDVIKGKTFPRYWPFVLGIHRSPMDSPDKGQLHRGIMFSLMCARTNGSKHTRYRWFEAPWLSLWRHCNDFNHQAVHPPIDASSNPYFNSTLLNIEQWTDGPNNKLK